MGKKFIYNIPTSWDEVTLGKFQRLNDEGCEDFVGVISVLADKPKDEVMALPADALTLLISKLEFMTVSPYSDKPSPSVVIDGEAYTVNVMEKLKTGEYVAADSVLKNDRNNFAALLAILCRKDGEVYDSVFEAERFDERREMFLRQPVTKILPIVSFFLGLLSISETPSLLYSAAEEAVSHTLRRIETSRRLGALQKYFLRRRVTKLEKSLRSNRPT